MNKTVSTTNKFWVTLLAAGTLWAGLGIGTVLAGDRKDYPGTFCRTTTNKYFGVSGGLTIYNKSTTRRLTVICPIIRDIMAKNAMVGWVKVRYYNPYFKDRQVRCRLYKFKPTGQPAAKTSYKSGNSSTPGGTISLKFPRQGNSRGGSVTPRALRGEGNYVVSCYLPKSGGRNANQRVQLTGYSAEEVK